MNSKFKELEESLRTQEFQTIIQNKDSMRQQNGSSDAVEEILDTVDAASDLVSDETLSSLGDALSSATEVTGDVLASVADVAGDAASAAIDVIGAILSGF